MKAVRWLSVAIGVIFLMVALGALVPRPFWPVSEVGPVERRILVLSNPIHTDIAIPLDAETVERLSPLVGADLPIELPGVRYVVFGWGSRAFYIETPTWSELRAGPVFQALTLDQSVMHVGIAGAIEESGFPVRAFDLTKDEFERLLAFIESSFQRGGDGRPVAIEGAAYGAHDAFFEANGRFNALLGCNTWAAAALREAGLRTGWWNPLPQSLGLSLDLWNSAQRSGGVQP